MPTGVMMEWYWWLAIMLVLIAVEAITLDLVLFMFAGGALAAALTSLAGGDITLQIVAFAVVSGVLLGALRPILLVSLRKRGEPLVETNVHALAGRPAVVVQPVSEDAGMVKLGGEVWSARIIGDGVLEVGTDVVVERIDGATAIVAPKQAHAG